MKRKFWILPLLFVFTASFLVGCVEDYKTSTVKATVLEKDYDAPETKKETYKSDGKTKTRTKRKPAEYDVTVQYKDIVAEFDDKNLYKRVQEGQEIKVLYKKGFDKNGKLVTEHIELID